MRHVLAWPLVAALLAGAPLLAQDEEEEEEEAGTEEERRPCFTHTLEGAAGLAVTRDGKWAGAADLEKLYLYRGGLAPTGFVQFSFRPLHLAAHPELPQLAVAAGNIRIVDPAAKKAVAEFKPSAWFAAWRQGGKQILGIDYDKNVQIWDVGTRKAVAKWKLPFDKKTSSRLEAYDDAAGLLALGFDDGTVRVFEAGSGRDLLTIKAHPVEGELRLNGLAISPDGRRIATSDFQQIKLWDAASGELKQRFSTRPGGLASRVRFLAGGTRIGFANYVDPGYGFSFLDAESGKLLAQGAISRGSIVDWDIAFPDSDDPTLVALDDNGTLHWCRYSAATGQKPGIVVKGGRRP
jgi:WD40 repeat protein